MGLKADRQKAMAAKVEQVKAFQLSQITPREPKPVAKGKQSKEARECAELLAMLREDCDRRGGVELLRKRQEAAIAKHKAAQAKPKPKAKGKDKPDPLAPLISAIREYERVSYFLATKGDFNFTMDDEAQAHFHTFIPARFRAIEELTELRAMSYGKSIPLSGDFIDGLRIRTAERVKRNKKGK